MNRILRTFARLLDRLRFWRWYLVVYRPIAGAGETFVNNIFCENFWTGAPETAFDAFKKVKLYTGDPGTEGKSNEAAENAVKAIGGLSSVGGGRGWRNSAAIEWPEVKANETITHIGIFNNSPQFRGWIELDEPVTLKIGDTFRIPKQKLVLQFAE